MDMTLAELQEMASRQQQQIEAQQQMLANKVSLEWDCLQTGTKLVRVTWGGGRVGDLGFFSPFVNRGLPFFGYLFLNLKVNLCKYPVVKHENNASDRRDHIAY